MIKSRKHICPAQKWPQKGGRGVAVSDIDFVWTLIKFIETIFAFGLQDDLTMITRLVQLALVGGIVRGKAVWDSHCHNKHCQGNPVRYSSPSCHNALIYEYGQYVHPALKKLFYQSQWKQLWWLHQQEEIHRTNWILLSKRCFIEQYHQLKMSQKLLDYSSFLHGIRPTPMSDIPYQVLSMERLFGGGSGAQFESWQSPFLRPGL